MKRAYIAVAMLVLLLTGCTLLSRYLLSSTAELAVQVAEFTEAAQQRDNHEAAAQKLDVLLRTWEKKRSPLIAVTGRLNCEPIEAAIVTIPVWFEQEEAPELMAALSQLSSHIAELGELQSPTFANLF